MKSSLLVAMTVAAGLSLSAVPAVQAAEEADRVLATVDGEEIRDSNVMKLYKTLPAQYKQAPLAFIKGQLVEQLINMQLISKAASAAKTAESQIYKDRLAEITVQLLQDTFLTKFVADEVTDDLIKAEYDKFVADFPKTEEMKARHILLKEEQQAKDVIKLLDEGGDFAKLAAEHSTGPSKTSGGDLGYFVKERMVPQFSAAAGALEIGKYTGEPVKTQFGWHVILLEDRRAAPPPTLAEKKAEIGKQITNDKVSALMAALKDKSNIVIIQAEEAPAAENKTKTE